MLDNQEYLQYLNSLNSHQLKKEIRSLDKQIYCFKQQITKLNKNEDKRNELLRRIANCDEKLKVAKDHFEKTTGKQLYNHKEAKNSQFNKLLDNLDRLTYLEEDLINGCRQITYRVKNEHIYLEYKNNYLFDSKNVMNQCLNITAEKFIENLKALELGKWKAIYNSDDEKNAKKLWRVKIYINDMDRCLSFSGHDAYPYNFKEFRKLLSLE